MEYIIILVGLVIFIVGAIAAYNNHSTLSAFAKREKQIKQALNMPLSADTKAAESTAAETKAGQPQAVGADNRQQNGQLPPNAARRATTSETIGLRRFYALDIPPEAPVYKIMGKLEHMILSGRHINKNKIWIGGIEIQLPGEGDEHGDLDLNSMLYPFIDDDEELTEQQVELLEQDYYCEIVLCDDKAYPVTINQASIKTLFSAEQKEWADKAGFRTASPIERRYLYPSSVVKPWLLLPMIAASYLAIYFSNDLWSIDHEGRYLVIPMLLVLYAFWPARYPNVENDIVQLNTTLELVPARFGGARYCRVAGSKSQLLIPPGLRSLFKSKQQISGQFELFYKGKGVNAKAGKLVSAQLFDHKYQLEKSLSGIRFRDQRYWLLRGAVLIISGVLALTILQANTRPDTFPQLVTYSFQQPETVRSAEDTLAIQAGSVVELDELLTYNEGVMNYIPLTDINEFITVANRSDVVDDLYQQWLDFGQQLEASVRYVSGTPFKFTQYLRSPLECIDSKRLERLFSQYYPSADDFSYCDLNSRQLYGGVIELTQKVWTLLYYRTMSSASGSDFPVRAGTWKDNGRKADFPELLFWGDDGRSFAEQAEYPWDSIPQFNNQPELSGEQPDYYNQLKRAYQDRHTVQPEEIVTLSGRYYVSRWATNSVKGVSEIFFEPYYVFLNLKYAYFTSLLWLALGAVILVFSYLRRPR
ncbi:hypothetical protein [Vibrio sp. SCSIO 43137]|uniref:hypothetical protein n=1 Tax=Vibrio sp. SCSIO 43137 TaxID=3021011 RepID=UPI002307A786|nr:hypothetical protein [Vibrio sp. SCSIO 43137]WCE32487.1 hypothetical protein PK654_18525 [Vibrio sp. SCSIO 43137]